MKKVSILALTGMLLAPCRLAVADPMAAAATPYVVGEWFLGDMSGDTPSVTTADTQFIFLNPTDHKQFNEYAF
jgi:hypothetical protein